MPRLLLYEVNTRCWLRELSASAGERVDLRNVPEEEFLRWTRWGVTHLWLMGVWTTGPRSRACYLEQSSTRAELDAALPGWIPSDVPGSPYAIAAYRVPDELGGETGLQLLRTRLHERGLQLILDFVPNHIGLDHPWLRERPELLVPAAAGDPGSFFQETARGPRWIAHGRDPYFHPWVDTAQVDYRSMESRQAVIQELKRVADRCDGVRCDMAMLPLNEVFDQTWAKFPRYESTPRTEFWPDAIDIVRRSGFIFLAEAYWDLEEKLQAQGFDYTYNKRVTDFILERRPTELRRHLFTRGEDFLRHSVHFLENHDEPRAALRFSFPEHRAAALLLLALPGMALLHEGQTSGARFRVPVQWGRRPREPIDPEVARWYDCLLTRLQRSSVCRGHARLLRPKPVAVDSSGHHSVVAVLWTLPGKVFHLAVVNLGPEEVSFSLDLPAGLILPGETSWVDCLSEPPTPANPGHTFVNDLSLLLTLPAFGAELLGRQPLP